MPSVEIRHSYDQFFMLPFFCLCEILILKWKPPGVIAYYILAELSLKIASSSYISQINHVTLYRTFFFSPVKIVAGLPSQRTNCNIFPQRDRHIYENWLTYSEKLWANCFKLFKIKVEWLSGEVKPETLKLKCRPLSFLLINQSISWVQSLPGNYQ